MSKTKERERNSRCQVTLQGSTAVSYCSGTLIPSSGWAGTDAPGQDRDSWSMGHLRKYQLGGRTGDHFPVFLICVFFFYWSIVDLQHCVNFCCARYVASVMSNPCDPMDCSPPGSSVHGILQARTLEWVVIPFSRGSS